MVGNGWLRNAAATMICAAPMYCAQAADFNESGLNDSLDAAQSIANSSFPFTIAGSRTFADPSDDFFSFNFLTAGVVRIEATSSSSGADSILGLFDTSGRLVASNDDGGAGSSMSALSFVVTAGNVGRFTVGIAGFNPGLVACGGGVTACYDTDGDFLFDTFVPGGTVAGSSTGWDYELRISAIPAVPEPASLLLLAPGLAVIAWRKRAQAARATG